MLKLVLFVGLVREDESLQLRELFIRKSSHGNLSVAMATAGGRNNDVVLWKQPKKSKIRILRPV